MGGADIVCCPAMTDVRLESVSKRFAARRGGVVLAVDCFDLHIPSGQCTVLVGPSGCGKTTLLRLIAGLETPSSGSIHIGGRDMASVEPRDRGVAMVLQDCAVYPHLTVRGNLRYPLTQRRTASWAASLRSSRTRTRRRQETVHIAQRVDAVASLLELDGLMDRRPDTLSGGEVQRLAFGRALVVEPCVLLADEPLSHIDAPLRTQLQGELRALYRQLGTTVIHVTHDRREAMALADVLVVMNAGVVRQVGPPEDVRARPADEFVAEFIGDDPTQPGARKSRD